MQVINIISLINFFMKYNTVQYTIQNWFVTTNSHIKPKKTFLDKLDWFVFLNVLDKKVLVIFLACE